MTSGILFKKIKEKENISWREMKLGQPWDDTHWSWVMGKQEFIIPVYYSYPFEIF